ncbi:MAG: hypothetical protein DRP20_05655 [Thermotogae bacterium]|nr:MAG: hypothetical protein DRP20_05655 [Thermotogota bacterium]
MTTLNNGVKNLPLAVRTVTNANDYTYAEAEINGMEFYLSINKRELSVDDQYINMIHLESDGSFNIYVENGLYTRISKDDAELIRTYLPDSLRDVCSLAISKVMFQ